MTIGASGTEAAADDADAVDFFGGVRLGLERRAGVAADFFARPVVAAGFFFFRAAGFFAGLAGAASGSGSASGWISTGASPIGS